MGYIQWLAEADKLCVKTVGIGVTDIEDYSWRSAYDDGQKPGEALYYCLEDNGYVARYPELLSQFVEQSEIV